MANERKKFSWRRVDQATFEQEKNLRILTKEVKHLGLYVLRRMVEPNRSCFAGDFPVRIDNIKPQEDHTNLYISLLDNNGQPVRHHQESFNPNGFIDFSNVGPRRFVNLPTGVIELGYLLKSVSDDPFDAMLIDYIQSVKPAVVESTTLITV